MITTAVAVREVCVVEGGRVRERTKAEDKGNNEKRQAVANRVKKNRYLPPPLSLGKICKKGIV